jgi:hypothetical protein
MWMVTQDSVLAMVTPPPWVRQLTPNDSELNDVDSQRDIPESDLKGVRPIRKPLDILRLKRVERVSQGSSERTSEVTQGSSKVRPSTALEDSTTLVPATLKALETVQPGQVLRLEAS